MPEFFFTTAANNQARETPHFRVTPVAGSLGAEVHDVDLTTLDDEGQTALRQALLDHQVLFIRDQQLDAAQLDQVARRFGEFGTEPYVTPMKEHPHIVHVRKEVNEGSRP